MSLLPLTCQGDDDARDSLLNGENLDGKLIDVIRTQFQIDFGLNVLWEFPLMFDGLTGFILSASHVGLSL